MRRLLCTCAGGPLGRQLVRAFVVVLACVIFAACGGDDGPDQTDGGEVQHAEGTLGEGDDGSDQSAEGTLDDDERGDPPTAGDGEAGGEIDGSGGVQFDRFPEPCGHIDVRDRLAEEEYELLIDQLGCVFENRDHMPPEALVAAQEAQATAERLDEEDEVTTETGDVTEPEPESEPEADG